jgi:hypothetical protein
MFCLASFTSHTIKHLKYFGAAVSISPVTIRMAWIVADYVGQGAFGFRAL